MSGAKIQTENDFTWGRLAFSRTYDSLRELPDNTYEGPAWGHSLGMQVVTTTDSNSAYVRGPTNEQEKFRRVDTNRFASVNIVGKVLDRQPSSTTARWILTERPGEQWVFDNSGTLQAVQFADSPADSLNLMYCDSTSYLGGLCDVEGALVSASDGRGRLLTFDYRASAYTTDNPPVLIPPRLISVSDDLGIRVTYQYDTLGRLSAATYSPGTPSEAVRHYLYGEAANLCTDGNGNAISPCPSSGFPYLLTGILDELGARYLNVTYDNLSRATSTTHAGGVDKVVLAYLLTNTQVTLPIGEVRTYAFGSQLFPRLSDYSVSGSGQSFSSHRTYDPTNDRMLQLTDERGFITQYGYDNYHQTSVISASGQPEQRSKTTTWDATTNRPTNESTSNASGSVESKKKWVYNSRGQTTARCEVDTGVSGADSYVCGSATNAPTGVRQWTYIYCEQSDVTAGTCPLVGLLNSSNGPRLTTDTSMGGLDDVTTYTYYQTDDSTCASGGACSYRQGDLWKITNALGQVTTYVSYDKNGRVTRTTDANGTATDFQYHARGWLTDRIVRANAIGTGANDATVHIDYDAVGNVTKITQPDSAYLSYTYDDAHRLIEITDNLGSTVDYCPGGVGSSDCLDAAGNRQIEQTKDPSNAIKRTVRRQYDMLGHLQKVLNAASQTTFDATNGYDGNGNLVLSTDGLGYQKQQTYDGLNRLVKTLQNYNGIDPATSNTQTSYAYDTRDNLRQVTDPDSLNTVYGYDELDNLTSLASPDTGNTLYSTDAAGNRASQTDARSITSSYTYDALNRLTSISYPTAGPVSYAYDQDNTRTGCSTSFPIGRLTKMKDGAGTTTYCYDRRGNVITKTQIVTAVTLVTQYSYTLADRIASITYPSGNLVTYNRDALGRVSSVTVKIGTTTTTLVSNASYYPFGPLNVLTFGNGRTLTKAYDQDYAIDQITASASGGLALDFAVDVMGDITNLNSGTRTYGYDPLYRLTSVSKGSALEQYTYNKTGDRLSAALNGGTAATYTYTSGTHHLASVGGTSRTYDSNGNTQTGIGGITLAYDDSNRLATATGTSLSAAYTINGRGERVRKAVTSGAAVTTLYSYDESGTLLGEYSGTGAPQVENVYLDQTPIGVVTSNTLSYIESDHLGSPRQVINPANNAAIWSWSWIFNSNAFGTNAPNQDPDGNGTAFILNLRLPGQYYDAETGLNYNYFRDYEPATGRYVESDPIGLKGGPNTYAYVRGNPLRRVDSMGLDDTVCMYNPASCGMSPPPDASYFGGEVFYVPYPGRPGGGSGVTWLECTDDCGKKHTYKYKKICTSLFTGIGISFGRVGGMSGANCKDPKRYEGWFAEGGYGAFGSTAGVDVGFNNDGTLSGVNEAGLGIGSRGPKAAMCYYVLVSSD